MEQMTQQERLIEEKKKLIMEKLQAHPPQPDIPKSSTYVQYIYEELYCYVIVEWIYIFWLYKCDIQVRNGMLSKYQIYCE